MDSTARLPAESPTTEGPSDACEDPLQWEVARGQLEIPLGETPSDSPSEPLNAFQVTREAVAAAIPLTDNVLRVNIVSNPSQSKTLSFVC